MCLCPPRGRRSTRLKSAQSSASAPVCKASRPCRLPSRLGRCASDKSAGQISLTGADSNIDESTHGLTDVSTTTPACKSTPDCLRITPYALFKIGFVHSSVSLSFLRSFYDTLSRVDNSLSRIKTAISTIKQPLTSVSEFKSVFSTFELYYCFLLSPLKWI